jgi:hypothetical protein
MGGRVVQNSAVQSVPNPIKLYALVAERNLSPQFPPQITRNYYAWSVSRNRDIIKTRRGR